MFGAGSIIGFDKYFEYGYTSYFTNGYAKHYYEDNGKLKSKGIRGFIVTKKNNYIYPSQSIDGTYVNILTSSFSNEFIFQDLEQTGSLSGSANIVSILTASGYLPIHHIYTGEKHIGLQNLYYKGCKNNASTTIDGKDAVQTFVTNPTTLRVSAQGRSTAEPILEVD